MPRRSNQNLSLKPIVSTTSVSPSHRPIEWPYHVGVGSSGMLAAVHEDLPVAVHVAFVQQEDVGRLRRGVLHQPPGEIGGDPQRPAGHAVVVGILGLAALRVQRLRRRRHDAFEIARLEPALDPDVRDRSASGPHTVEIDRPVGQARHRPIGRSRRRPRPVVTAEPLGKGRLLCGKREDQARSRSVLRETCAFVILICD